MSGPPYVPVLSVKELTVSFGGRFAALGGRFAALGGRFAALGGRGRRSAARVNAVDSLSFDLYGGECLGLVGESGSGKSVTALAVLGLLSGGPARIDKGKILFKSALSGGKTIDLLTERSKGLRRVRGAEISMIFQDPMASLTPYLRVSDQMVEAVRAHRSLSRSKALAMAVEGLERVGIADAVRRIHDYPHRFSGGMCQRILIAMALLLDPCVLLADEPTTALDVTIQAQILELLDSCRERIGTAVLLITHDLGIVAERTNRVLVIYAGRIVESAPTTAIFERPAHPYTIALHQSLPAVTAAAGTRINPIPGQPPRPEDRSGAAGRGCAFGPRCQFAEDRCRTGSPPLIEVALDHRAACWRVEKK